MLDFILRTARAQRFGQIVPELKKARIQHDENASDVSRTVLVEKKCPGWRVEVFRRRPLALAVQELRRDQRIEEVADAALVQTESRTEFRAGHAATCKFGEHTELDGGEQNLR